MRREKLKHFANKIIDINLYDYILDNYDIDNWDEVINYISDLSRNHKDKKWYISNNSIKLAIKIKTELNIDVFLIIFRTYAGKWLKAGAAFTWFMYMDNTGIIGGCSNASKYIKKNSRLELYTGDNDLELMINDLELTIND